LLLTGQLHSQLHPVAEQVVAVLNKSEAAEHVIVVYSRIKLLNK
jgi:hypothetical protein